MNLSLKQIAKKISLILVAALLTSALAACGLAGSSTAASTSTAVQSGEAVTSTAASASAASVGFPVTLTDASGEKVTIEKKPAKIVCLPLGACEMLVSLVDKSSIAAMTHYVDDENVSNIADQVKGVGARLDTNVEKIIAIQPDLVLLDIVLTKPEVIKQLRDAKINVFVLSLPYNIDQERNMLKLLGQLTGEQSKAQELDNWMDTKLKAVSDKLSTLTEDQKLTVVDYSEMGTTSGKGTNFDDIVNRAGLINPVSKEGIEGWPQLSKEMIVKYNPDIISLPSWYYDTKISYESLANSIKNDKALAGVKAVKNNKLFALPYKHMTSTSQYSVLIVEEMAKAAYPELFK